MLVKLDECTGLSMPTKLLHTSVILTYFSCFGCPCPCLLVLSIGCELASGYLHRIPHHPSGPLPKGPAFGRSKSALALTSASSIAATPIVEDDRSQDSRQHAGAGPTSTIMLSANVSQTTFRSADLPSLSPSTGPSVVSSAPGDTSTNDVFSDSAIFATDNIATASSSQVTLIDTSSFRSEENPLHNTSEQTTTLETAATLPP